MHTTAFRCVLLLLLVFAIPLSADHPSEIRAWQEKRLKNLQSDDGWPTLVGLYWLNEGSNRVGSGKDCVVVLPSPAPADAGVMRLEKGKVRFEPHSAVPVNSGGKPVTGTISLMSDSDPKVDPTILEIGSIRFFVIERGSKVGVRVRDRNSPSRKKIAHLEYYPIHEQWRVEATFEAYKPARKIQIANVLGMLEDTDSIGALVFRLNGQSYRLDVLDEAEEKEFFVIFGDRTNGKATYPAGRYIYTSYPDANGKVILDFNKAYSPPCAFTNFATCPLPPKQNKLPIAIEAGEKYSKELHP